MPDRSHWIDYIGAALVTLCLGLAGCQRGDAQCLRVVGGLCLLHRLAGDAEGGELGFRFAPPRDATGDGIADIAAGARFTAIGTSQSGETSVWSGADAQRVLRWQGDALDGLFGHAAILIPDVDGDGLADLVAAAPTATIAGAQRGVVTARSPRSGRILWSVVGERGEALGWDLAIAGDHTGDGLSDLFVGAPGADSGKVYLISGRDGRIVRVYSSARTNDSFGWYVAAVADMDGDTSTDLVVGSPLAAAPGRGQVGAAAVISSARGAVLREWWGTTPGSLFGEVVCGIGDLDSDGTAEIAISAPHTDAQSGVRQGEVFVYSGATGAVIHHFKGRQIGELYGRMVARAGDFDGDGGEDLAISAPWYRAGTMNRAGRMEIRSGRTGSVLAALTGDGPRRWLGWHIARAANIGATGRPGLLVSSLRSRENALAGAGAIEIYAYQRAH
ncbi:MAG: integrin alpha [Proteobacteria bacterium]|nr:integrin alpha [Pseudomonadota bacterium]